LSSNTQIFVTVAAWIGQSFNNTSKLAIPKTFTWMSVVLKKKQTDVNF